MTPESIEDERLAAGAEEGDDDAHAPIVAPGRNCWRTARADRAAVLIDGDAYFSAFRMTAAKAERSIFIVGWDIDSRIVLHRGPTGDGLPAELGPFLDALARRRPRLHVYVLDWDYVLLYALDRQLLPRYHFGTRTHRRVRFWLDDRHPVGASHHQKLVVIDDRVAFVGGMDLSTSRWDSSDHLPGDPRRVNPDGSDYPPVHDVQCMVDGEAAAAIGELARARWERATGRRPRAKPASTGSDPWPRAVVPDFTGVDVAIARTEPMSEAGCEVREVEALYLDSIAAARSLLYVENQYLTSSRIGQALAARLAEADGPEIVVLSRASGGGWLEESTMQVLRARLLERLRACDPHGRLRVYYPHHRDLDGQWINLHAKLMIVDDRLLRIGSSNLANRSLGYDTECDVAIEANDSRAARSIAALRNRLLAEHLDVAPARVAAEHQRHGSLIAAIEALRGNAGTLEVLDGRVDPQLEALVPDEALLDPERPVDPEQLLGEFVPEEARPRAGKRLAAWLALVVVIAALAVAWRWGPLSHWLGLEGIERIAERADAMPMAPAWVLAAFVIASVIAVPITLLIFGASVVFGPLEAFGYALVGSLAGAAVTFAIGRALGRNTIRRLAGRRLHALSKRLGRRGVLAVVAVRVLPVAPFAVVNLVAGASHIAFRDFVLGTVIGMLPGISAITLFSDRLLAALRMPSAATIAILVAIVAAIVAGAWSLRRWLLQREAREDRLEGGLPGTGDARPRGTTGGRSPEAGTPR